MPYGRGYKKKSNRTTYNKHQKSAYKRRGRSYKNRQQLLSIKTVKSIAREVVQQHPELKFKEFKHYDGEGDFNTLINGP